MLQGALVWIIIWSNLISILCAYFFYLVGFLSWPLLAIYQGFLLGHFFSILDSLSFVVSIVFLVDLWIQSNCFEIVVLPIRPHSRKSSAKAYQKIPSKADLKAEIQIWRARTANGTKARFLGTFFLLFSKKNMIHILIIIWADLILCFLSLSPVWSTRTVHSP